MPQQVICGIFLLGAEVGCAQKRAELGTMAQTRNLSTQEAEVEESVLQGDALSQENNKNCWILDRILYFQIRSVQFISICLFAYRQKFM